MFALVGICRCVSAVPDSTGFFIRLHVGGNMKSVRKALRGGDLYKDTYERLNCNECEKPLKTENDPDEIWSVRVCPDCGGRWKEL